jgi:outer membrane protein assembly factor BamB
MGIRVPLGSGSPPGNTPESSLSLGEMLGEAIDTRNGNRSRTTGGERKPILGRCFLVSFVGLVGWLAGGLPSSSTVAGEAGDGVPVRAKGMDGGGDGLAFLHACFERASRARFARIHRSDPTMTLCQALSRSLLFISSLLPSMGADADDWPQWRGPNGNGTASATAAPLATDFSEKDIAWKTPLPGTGSSTPAVWGERIFITGPAEGKDALLCYGMDGKEQWRALFGEQTPGKHEKGTGSNPSPLTDGERIYAYFKSGTLAAVDFKGKETWRVNLQEQHGKDTLWWDLGTSPVLAGGRLVVAVLQEGDSFLVALDPKTGKEVWKTKRMFETTPESDQTYSTPSVIDYGGGKIEVVSWGADHLTGHDAATGKENWSCGGFNPNSEKMWRTIASPSYAEGVIVQPYGRGKFVAGVRAGGSGDVTKTHRLWEHDDRGADVPTPVAANGRAILLNDRGKLMAHDLTSGEQIWESSLPRERGNYFASPVLVGSTLLCTREDGALMFGTVGDMEYRFVTEVKVGERVIATPVPVNGKLIVRGAEHLMCLSK